jgi:hypothetical protein
VQGATHEPVITPHRSLARGSLSLLVLLATVVTVACGSSSNGSTSSGQQGDAGGDASSDGAGLPEAATDAGDGSSSADADAPYPAFMVDAPQIQKNQGAVLASPVIVTISWPSDTNAATWEAFDDGIGASSYWTATTAEYGVGAATSGAANHVRMARPLPASLSYTDLQNFVTAALAQAVSPPDGGTPESGASDAGSSDAGPPDPVWPAPTMDAKGVAQTIYSLFIPSSTAVTDPGTGTSFCVEGATGYHAYVTVGTTNLVYSVTLQCAPVSTASIEETAAHETIESATDPYMGSGGDGYHGYDANHLAWDLYTGYNDELGDACQAWQYAYTQLTGSFPYWVQLSWSNKAAAAGHDPCVPSPTGPYHGMTLFPKEETTVSANLSVIGLSAQASLGFDVTVGQPIQFHVGFYSDAPAPAWTISYDFPSTLPTFDTNFMPLGNGSGTVMLSQTTGKNGDQVTVTVKSTAKGEGGFQVMAITWDPPTGSGFLPKYLPVLLVDH